MENVGGAEQPDGGPTAACFNGGRERVTVMVMVCLLMECEVNKGEERRVEEVDGGLNGGNVV